MDKIFQAPNSKEAEMMVLGCMLTSFDSLNASLDILQEEDFYFTEHRVIFQTMSYFRSHDKTVDLHLVCEELKRCDKLTNIGGVAYVTSLAVYAGTSAFVEEYCKIIKNKSTLRKMISACREIEKSCCEDPDEVDECLDTAQQKFFTIGREQKNKPGVLIGDILSGKASKSGKPFLVELQERQERFLARGPEEAGISGIPTSFIDIDNVIDGLVNSNLIILASRPAMGKTALALNIAENVCFKSNLPVGIFSLEMSGEQLVNRTISSQSEISAEKIQRGDMTGTDYQKIVAVVEELSNHSFVIDDQPGLSINDLRARARRMKERFDIGLLVIDYLQLLTTSRGYRDSENRQTEVSEISRMLKNLARELDIPIICLSQLSRKVEERSGNVPLLSDLRESGSIEQDADQVLLLLRREYYNKDEKIGEAEIHIAKNRHGKTGKIDLYFRKDISKFENSTKKDIGEEIAQKCHLLDKEQRDKSFLEFQL